MASTDGIEVNPEIMAGKPVVKGTRIPVYVVLQMLEEDTQIEDILEAYPDLEREKMYERAFVTPQKEFGEKK
ncbi:DUF433 domain-containing protein [Candidatus Nanohalobium constans]|uniref:Antitoxin-like protein n=1 Tax=Candidatus Nanohalobium constans TaxID=2565781 RepID=A0A5Q0UHC9_9ARCH|nr:DUF433 domain-containing protein [Candidatus Nanohalobium constans]QGA80355.1 antitoxin-like protein [Candidatus Nanohalobium constans]